MKMEVIAVQQQYQHQYNLFGTNKVRDWTSTLTPPPTKLQAAARLPYLQTNTTNKMKSSINKKSNRMAEVVVGSKVRCSSAAVTPITTAGNAAVLKKKPVSSYETNNSSATTKTKTTATINTTNNLLNCDDIDAAAVNSLSMRLLDELRAAKSRHLTCTEVSLPCDLTPRVATEILRVSAKEPCGVRGCTIYIEFEDEPNNSRRIATLKVDPGTVSTFEVYLTLRQDHRGWIALLPQFMKSLSRTITISPEFSITKHKLYSPHEMGYSSSGSGNYFTTPLLRGGSISGSIAIATSST